MKTKSEAHRFDDSDQPRPRTTERQKLRAIGTIAAILATLFVVLSVDRTPRDEPPVQDNGASSKSPREIDDRPADRGIRPPLNHQLSHTRTLSYGTGDQQVGLQRLPETEARGPESFVVDEHGSLHVADKVNSRICTFTPDGTLEATLPLPGFSINDLMVYAPGCFVVFDASRGTLSSLDEQGSHLSSLGLSLGRDLSRGYFHILGDRVLFADGAVSDVHVATLEDGILQAVDSRVRYNGVHGTSGRRFDVGLVPERALNLTIWNQGQPHVPQASVDTQIDGILSARFAGETSEGLACIQIERLREDEVLVEVLLYGTDGEAAGHFELPWAPYHIWTNRLLDIAPNGDVFQFAPGPDNALLRVFSTT